MYNPHMITREFEYALSEYTGAPFVVCVNSCTMALLLAVKWALKRALGKQVEIPERTYVSVPQSILHAGGWPIFRDEQWSGMYQLKPLPVWDSARWLTGGMYRSGQMMCLSFHASKTLGIEQGGAILLDSQDAYEWLKRARFDGRTEGVAPKDDTFDMVGWHCYMNPSTAAQGLMKIHALPKVNAPLPNDDYPDLSKIGAFI